MLGAVDSLETDLAIIGGGIMGTSVAYQASTLGLKAIVLENENLRGPHYSSSLWSPRADYIPKDIDEVKRTDLACSLWQFLFPSIIRPHLFLLPVNEKTPHSFESLKSLMELYDRLTPHRLSILPSPHFVIDGASLEQMEPNIKRGHFSKAIGFYELIGDSNLVRDALWNRTLSTRPEFRKIVVNKIELKKQGDHINELTVSIKNGSFLKIYNKNNKLVVVNAAGPWINEVAGFLDIRLPVSLYAGIQLAFPQRYSFSSIILTFTEDGKYLVSVPAGDYLRVGPSNFKLKGGLIDFLSEGNQIKKHVDWIKEAFFDFVEPGFINTEPKIHAVGARVKLNLRFGIDSNRSFVIPADDYGIDNFLTVYPGKLPSALSVADELLKLTSDRGLISDRPNFFLGPKSRLYTLVSSDNGNTRSIIFSRLKSLIIVGGKIILDKIQKALIWG